MPGCTRCNSTLAARPDPPHIWAMERNILEIGGADREHFLQGLVTNDVIGLTRGELVYAALLSPQGKYLADFFLVPLDGRIGLDVAAALAPALVRRLAMYKLRSDVTIAQGALSVGRGLGDTPPGAFADPRDPSLGWRLYAPDAQDMPGIDWDALRVQARVPEHGTELLPDDSYILEHRFEPLSGVDFRKGCYVGQEVTARMKHKTELKKGLARGRITGAAEPGTEIFTEAGKPAGRLGTVAGDSALAWLRFDRAAGPLHAGDATLIRDDTPAQG
jgi:folate-binding protein YgfZ